MDLRLDDNDDRRLRERAGIEKRSEEEIAREAIHVYLTDPARLAADIEDAEAVERYLLCKRRGGPRHVSNGEVRERLGLAAG